MPVGPVTSSAADSTPAGSPDGITASAASATTISTRPASDSRPVVESISMSARVSATRSTGGATT